MEKLIFSLGLILAGLSLGYILQFLDSRNTFSLPIPLTDLRKILQKIGLLFFMPISFIGAVWILSFADLRIILLPVIGITALISGGILGLGLALLLRKNQDQTGVLICCGSFTNIGSIGSLVCFMFLGETGFALVALYRMFEDIAYYSIGFPIARFYSGNFEQDQSFCQRILGVLKDPFVAAALGSFMIGFTLNLSGVVRPEIFKRITALSVPIGTFVLIVSIGLGMNFSSVSKNMRDGICVSLIKFVIVPFITCGLSYLLGFHLIDNGLPFKVVLVLSCMPVAFNALVASSIYDLDLDLANSCWLITTGSLVVIMPLLYFLLLSF